MSVITSHILTTPNEDVNMQDLLKDLIGTYDLIRYVRVMGDYIRHPCENVLDMNKCAGNEEERAYQKEKGLTIRILSHDKDKIGRYLNKGFEITKEENYYTDVRRDVTEEELDAMMREHVSFPEDKKSVIWYRNYGSTDIPAFMISRTYPDTEFHYMEFCESDRVLDIMIKGGEITKDMLAEERKAQEERYLNILKDWGFPDENLVDYLMNHKDLTEAVIANHGDMMDLDCMVAISNVFGYDVSYEDYSKINGTDMFDDMGLFNVTEEHKELLKAILDDKVETWEDWERISEEDKER